MMGKWQPIETAPKEGVFLVWLAEEMLGTNVSVCERYRKISTIGGRFAFDMPKPLYWMPLPKVPKVP